MTHEILGIRVDDLDDRELRNHIEAFLDDAQPRIIVTPNPEMVLLAQDDVEFRNRLNRADLCLPDGVGLKYAVAVLTGRQLAHRHTGVDTLMFLADICAHQHKRMLFLGGESGEGEASAKRIMSEHLGLRIEALDPGRVSSDASLDESILNQIEELRPDVIAVALGHGKQEAVMERLSIRLPFVRIFIGIGGAFNMISGRLRRAPKWMQNCGLEWLWRVLIEPSRLPRTFRATVVFPIRVIWAKLKH